MAKRQSKQRRKRGVFLSNEGWQRLQAAELKFVDQENQENPSALEILSEKTKLSPNTITKVRHRQAAVDRQTLEIYFKAFGLPLTAEDYQPVDAGVSRLPVTAPIYGQVALDSPFYISREPLETLCHEAMMQSGALLNIRGPKQSGKTSLVTHSLVQGREQGLITQMLSFRLVDGFVIESFEGFLRWFCAVVTRRLGLPDRIDDLWNPSLGNSFNCTAYFEQYLLEQLSEGLVLVLDDIDGLFQAPEFAADFLNMLRTWHEMAQYGGDNGQRWGKLRLVMLHSPGGYAFESPSLLPVNFGQTLDLPNFSQAQIATLIERYNISLGDDLAPKLMHFLGGKPNLVQLTLQTIQQKQMSLEQIVQTVTSPDSIFADHLLYYCNLLNQYPKLKDGIRQIVQGEQPVLLTPLQALHLSRLELITCQQQDIQLQCYLYQKYFNYILGGVDEGYSFNNKIINLRNEATTLLEKAKSLSDAPKSLESIFVKTPKLIYPDPLLLEKEFELKISLDLEPLEDKYIPPNPDQKELLSQFFADLILVLRVPHFISKDKYIRNIRMGENYKSEEVFMLTPRTPGTAEIRVDFYQHDRRIGTSRSNVVVIEE